MMKTSEQVFFALLRGGLWEQEVKLASFRPVDFEAVYKMAEMQSVLGLVAAGLEHVVDMKVPRNDVLPFLTQVMMLEQRNKAMNVLVGQLTSVLRNKRIQAVLIKGQGVAQCYDRPLWRAAGDIDFLFDAKSYENAKTELLPLASDADAEIIETKHLGMTLNGFEVELHGTYRYRLSSRVDKMMEQVQYQVCSFGAARAWRNKETNTDIILPSPDNDVLIIFTHFLRHFFRGGIGIRQICDWCRLLWTFRDIIDKKQLLDRLRAMDMVCEWKAFAAFAVEYLGMPKDAMPLYSSGKKWLCKAHQILKFVLEKGNFGNNEDYSYYKNHSYIIRKTISLWHWVKNYSKLFVIFPKNSTRALYHITVIGLMAVAKGE